MRQLKHLDKDQEKTSTHTKKDKNNNIEQQYEEFLRDIEEDKELRKNVNIYKDDEVLKELEGKFKNLKVNEKDEEDSDIDIKVEELLDDLNLNDKEEDLNEVKQNEKANNSDSIDFAENEEVVDTFTKPQNVNKRELGKRERTGN